MRMNRPILTECLEPPEDIRKYIQGTWKDVELLTEIELAFLEQ